MGIYFGTDGIRGIYGQEISPQIAFKVGNSLGRLCNKTKKVVVGRDTRKTGTLLLSAFASGIMSQGVDVVDVGIVPTPVVAFLAKEEGFDFGVIISASHNPADNNGIKIFDENGFKIDTITENLIESKMLYLSQVEYDKVGSLYSKPKLANKYKEKILSFFSDLRGQKVVLDLANGASYKLAKELFTQLGAKTIILNNKHKGLDINRNCGALSPAIISEAVKKYKADIGFSFDGDADRIIACDEKGNILDGDDILFVLSKAYPKERHLVGTTMTNKALEVALAKKKIKLLRTDVGDKYVADCMKKNKIKLGGEPAGHIINLDFSTTGDGVLTALMLANIKKQEGKPLSEICTLKHYPQILINVDVENKINVLNSDLLNNEIAKFKKALGSNGRIIVRASGTENKIRIMCEHKDQEIAKTYCTKLANIVKSIK